MALMRSRRVLIVDNDPHFRSSVEVLLDARGYTVFATGTHLEARHIAQRERVHVAVLDIRMESDPDHDDMSGLTLARKLDPSVIKIMLTAYPSLAAIRRSSFGDVPAANFVFKDEGPEALLNAMAEAFTDKVRINFDLSIQWQGVELEDIAQTLELESRVSIPVIRTEIEEVLCKLFRSADEIVVTPLVPINQMRHSTSQSGAVVLKVQPHYPGGWAVPVVVKLASRKKIELEATNYKQYVQRFIDGFRHTLLQDQAHVYFLGGIVYTLVGTPLEGCVDLGTFYTTHTAEETVTALEDLFLKTCHHWYDNQVIKQTCDLVQLYAQSLKISIERIEAGLVEAGLADWVGQQRLILEPLQRTIINPVEWFRQHASLTGNVAIAYTHGDLHSRNVLIDHNHQAWLIDFYRSGPGHIFRDLIELESDIKFTLLENSDLQSLFNLEVALLNTKQFDDQVAARRFQQPELQKALIVVLGIRRIAGTLVDSLDMFDYYQGLLLQTLATTYLRHIDPAKKRHAFLAAALLCQRLENW